MGDEVGEVRSSQFTQGHLSTGSRLDVLLGSLGRILSRGMPYCMSEEAEKHKNHQSERMRLAVMNLGHPRRPGSQLEFHQPRLRNINWHELKDNTILLLHHEETGAKSQHVWPAWAMEGLGCQVLCFTPASLLCLLTHMYIFQRHGFTICSPSDISERAFVVCFQ